MLKKIFVAAAVVIAAYLVFVIALTPASVALEQVKLPKTIKLGQVDGTIWSPSISQVNFQGINVHQVNADISPLALLLMSINADVRFGDRLNDGPKGQGNIALSQSEIKASDLTVNMAANEVAPLLPLPIPVEAFGEFQLNITALTLVDNKCQQAQGTLTWQRAAVRAMEQDIELGNFSASISCEQDKLALTLAPDNRLGLSYQVLVNLTGRMSGQGYLQPGADFPKQLKDALPFIGNPDAQGRYLLKF